MSQRVHLYLSLVFGLLLMVAAGSGLLLAGSALLDQLQAPVASGQNLAAVAERVVRQVPGAERLERAPSGELRVSFSSADGEGVVRVDPATGRVLGDYVPSPAMAWIRTLHRDLLLGDGGRLMTGVGALALALLSLSGLFLLARRLGGWRRLFSPLPPVGGAGQWHTRVARWGLPLLLVLALSGAYLSAASQGLIADGQGQDPSYPESSSAGPAAPIGQLHALRRLSLDQLRELELPMPGDGFYTLHLAQGDGYVDAVTGQWLSYQPHGSARNLYELAYRLHTGGFGPIWTLLLGAAAGATLFLAGSGLLVWWRRRQVRGAASRGAAADEADTLVLVGSQAGSTWAIARQLQAQLVAAGCQVHCAPMNELASHYPNARRLLVLTATHGDGEAPDSARSFLDRLARGELGGGLEFAVLGFGDSRFPRYCGYAVKVDQQLRNRGLTPLLPMASVDRQDPAQLQQWAQRLGQRLGLALDLKAGLADEPRYGLTLLSRELYGREGDAPAAVLRFACEGATFAPGDLLGVRPGPGEAVRYYSIASSTEDGYLEICVRRHAQGRCSGWLHELALGERIEGSLQAHPEFRPVVGLQPVILIGAGTGLAPLMGFIRTNRLRQPMHLFWGGRCPESDFLYESELGQCLNDGRLQRLSLAFSQGHERHYVQDRLREQAEELRALLTQGAQVRVCGSRDMAQGVRNALVPVLASLGVDLDGLRQQGRYREDVY